MGGGYLVDFFIQNVAGKKVTLEFAGIEAIGSDNKSYEPVENERGNGIIIDLTGEDERVDDTVSYTLESGDGREFIVGFLTGNRTIKKFILSIRYSDGSITTWEIQTKTG